VFAFVGAFAFGVGANLADFCRRPERHFEDLIQERVGLSEDAEAVVLYYSTCDGANPLAEDLAEARSGVVALNETAARSYDDCDPDSALRDVQGTSARIVKLIDAFFLELDCGDLNGSYQRLVHSAACRSLLSAIYTVAVQNAVASALVLVFLYATNWVCETILLEEEYFLQPHPEIFTVTTFAGTSNQIDLDIDSTNDADRHDDDDDPATTTTNQQHNPSSSSLELTLTDVDAGDQRTRPPTNSSSASSGSRRPGGVPARATPASRASARATPDSRASSSSPRRQDVVRL